MNENKNTVNLHGTRDISNVYHVLSEHDRARGTRTARSGPSPSNLYVSQSFSERLKIIVIKMKK